ncbi:MAG: hypothetical protein ACK4M9_06665 [Anaerobacillus sp.]|uniref:hypothetical protein n=1 Tax=Anaerobacillus sp. TaxID=1872506 RepID=UPI003919E8DF
MEEVKSKLNYEALLWSIALPGFGQFLNKKIVKGIVLIFFEVIINVMSNFNLAILKSFNGNIYGAIEVTNFQWLMFYPCFYIYSLWDAFRDSNQDIDRLLFLPFAFSAYSVTVGLIYSQRLTIFGVLPGPVFLPMLFLIPGLIIGFTIRKIIRH